MADESDYYPADDAAAPSEASDEETSESPAEENAEGETALLPKSLFGGDCKPGDKYTVEVVHVYDDELEVKPAGKADDNNNEPSSPQMDEAMGKLQGMTS